MGKAVSGAAVEEDHRGPCGQAICGVSWTPSPGPRGRGTEKYDVQEKVWAGGSAGQTLVSLGCHDKMSQLGGRNDRKGHAREAGSLSPVSPVAGFCDSALPGLETAAFNTKASRGHIRPPQRTHGLEAHKAG